jgi:hypothetical protein
MQQDLPYLLPYLPEVTAAIRPAACNSASEKGGRTAGANQHLRIGDSFGMKWGNGHILRTIPIDIQHIVCEQK